MYEGKEKKVDNSDAKREEGEMMMFDERNKGRKKGKGR